MTNKSFFELLFEFMGEHQVLTFFIIFFVCGALAEIGKAIVGALT